MRVKRRKDIWEKSNEIIKLYRDNLMNAKEIGKMFKCNPCLIYKILKENNEIDASKRKIKSWNKDLTMKNDIRLKKTSETHRKGFDSGRIERQSGDKNPFYKKKHKEDSIKKIRDARAKQNFSFTNSKIEIKIQTFLETLGIEHYKHFCINKIEHSYNCDFFIPSMNLIIEADGDYFHGNPSLFPFNTLNKKQIEQKNRDEFRNKELIDKGYNLLRLWENEITNMNVQQFQNKILQYGRTQ